MTQDAFIGRILNTRHQMGSTRPNKADRSTSSSISRIGRILYSEPFILLKKVRCNQPSPALDG
jgi:hypothetical protein